MGSEANLKLWISDKLMSLLGYSKSTVVQYVIGLTKLASSPADVVGTLVEFGLSSSSETRAFAKEIARFPRKSGGVNLYHKQEREAAMLARKQKIYQLLDSNKKRFRRKSANQDKDEDNEVAPSREEDRRVKRRTSGGNSGNDDGFESEEERLRDQREREELERQIRKWDAARTQKLTEPKMSKEEEEEAIRRSNALDKDDLEALRKVSRQEYLKKSEEKKLEELRDEIEDEQYLFEGFELTEAERRELRYKKEIYELVTKRWTEDAGEISEVISSIEQVPRKGAKREEKRKSSKAMHGLKNGMGAQCQPCQPCHHPGLPRAVSWLDSIPFKGLASGLFGGFFRRLLG